MIGAKGPKVSSRMICISGGDVGQDRGRAIEVLLGTELIICTL